MYFRVCTRRVVFAPSRRMSWVGTEIFRGNYALVFGPRQKHNFRTYLCHVSAFVVGCALRLEMSCRLQSNVVWRHRHRQARFRTCWIGCYGSRIYDILIVQACCGTLFSKFVVAISQSEEQGKSWVFWKKFKCGFVGSAFRVSSIELNWKIKLWLISCSLAKQEVICFGVPLIADS